MLYIACRSLSVRTVLDVVDCTNPTLYLGYMSTKFEDPLLSLTVSTTLREKPLPITPPRKALATLLEEVGGSGDPLDILSPVKSAVGPGAGFGEQEDDEDLLSGLEEINLLEGLQAGNTLMYTW